MEFRWKRDDYGNKVKGPASNKHILQFVLIKRSDNGEWAIPGVNFSKIYYI
jgi:hypothetical protein